jgi:hypothetical protein
MEISWVLDAARNALRGEKLGLFFMYPGELPLRMRYVCGQDQIRSGCLPIARKMPKMAGISHQCLRWGVSERAWASEPEDIPMAWLLFGAHATPFGMEVFNRGLNPFR